MELSKLIAGLEKNLEAPAALGLVSIIGGSLGYHPEASGLRQNNLGANFMEIREKTFWFQKEIFIKHNRKICHFYIDILDFRYFCTCEPDFLSLTVVK